MEQKKTLWIIAAVGAFLLVVLGAAGILYSPVRNPTPAIATVAPVDRSGRASSGWTEPVDVRPPLPAPTGAEVPAAKVNDMIVLADNTTVYNLPKTEQPGTTIDLNALKNGYYAAPEAQESAPRETQNINITVNVPEQRPAETVRPESTPAPSYERDVPRRTPAQNPPAQKTERTAVASAPQNQGESRAASSSSQTKAASSGSSSVKVSVNGNASVTVKEEPKKTQFWVQVAAYSNKKGAEGARAVLDSNKIPADVFTYQDNKSKLYYRVRVGPYTTKSEAEYWRTRIVKIDEFAKAESFVTSTTN